MAVLTMQYGSFLMQKQCHVTMIVPNDTDIPEDHEYPTLYLLHGYSGDHTSWLQGSQIVRYANQHKIVVIMPSVYNGWYTDTKTGDPYFTYITEELPKICRSMFRHISTKRETTFVAGLSMGGFGAMKVGLAFPERFAGIAAFSSAFDIVMRAGQSRERSPYFASIFGTAEEIPNSINDVFYLAKKVKESGNPLPKVYLWCGTEDSLLPETRQMKDCLEGLGYPLSYQESTGDHSWGYWDEQIALALPYLLKDLQK